ncbi:MAG TPA: HPr family phosphocarrier protein, partial [Lachnospiraceae bacterium]|nr:HPr family phosphocarrier protein [Lachnospiraceae bacterium]
MKSFNYEVTSDLGIHARPAANLAQTCVNLAS